MARTGRPPKPIEQKRLEGNPGKRSLPVPSQTHALSPAPRVPDLPEALKEYGAERWTKIWMAAGAWLSPDVDGPTVETVCRTYDECRELRELLEEHGMLLEEPIVTPAGVEVGTRLVPNPAAKMLRAAEKQLQSWLSDLGFSPTARSRLGLAEVKRQSILRDLVSQPTAPTGAAEVEIVILPDD